MAPHYRVVATIHDGQVVTGMPDHDALKNYCLVQYSDNGKTVSGYVLAKDLAVVQPPQGMVTGDPSAQKTAGTPLADELSTWTSPATGLMWTKSDNGWM